jgi:hypothetical protein
MCLFRGAARGYGRPSHLARTIVTYRTKSVSYVVHARTVANKRSSLAPFLVRSRIAFAVHTGRFRWPPWVLLLVLVLRAQDDMISTRAAGVRLHEYAILGVSFAGFLLAFVGFGAGR